MLKKAPRWLVIALTSVIALVSIVYLLIPPVARYYIETHSEEWTGRKVLVERIRLNPFTASVAVEGLTMFEKAGTGTFISLGELYVNLSFWPTVYGNTTVEELTLTAPVVRVVQHGDAFNYDDLVARFATADTSARVQDAAPVFYRVEQIAVKSGTFVYANTDLGNEISLVSLEAGCPGIASDDPRHHYDFRFAVAQGGKAAGSFDVNLDSLDYTARYDVKDLNLEMLFPYLKDYLNISSFTGALNCRHVLKGNFNAPEAVALSGNVQVLDFMIKDPQNEPLLGVGNLLMEVDTLHMRSDLYVFNAINITRPYLKFELFDVGNNFSRLMHESDSIDAGAASMPMAADSLAATDSVALYIADGNIFKIAMGYIRDLAKNYSFSNYRADSVVLREGSLIFNDYTLHHKFNYVLENLLVKAERLNSENQNLTFAVASTLNTSGRLTGEIKVEPEGFRDMEFNYTVTDMLLSDFNPYSDYYIAHPFDGVCFYSSTNSIKARMLKSENKLEIKKIVVGKKVKNNTAYNLPIRLAVALLRDVNGNVLIELPVEGNLDDPKYRFGKVIWQVFKNLITKAIAAPGKLLAKKSGVEEKYLTGFMWQPLQTDLDPEMLKSLDALAKVLETTPELNAELITVYNHDRELDELALKEGKKKFLFFRRRISSEETPSSDDEQAIDALPPKDSVFNAYLEQQTQTQGAMVSSIDKSKKLIGESRLEAKLQKIYEQRSAAITQYMREQKQVPENRFRMADEKEKSKISYTAPSKCVAGFFVDEE